MTAPAPIDPMHFRQVLGRNPTGVCVIAAFDTAGAPIGMTVGTFSSVSLDPPLVSFMPQKTSSTWPAIRAAERFSVSVLSADQEGIARRFGRRVEDRFEGCEWSTSGTGLPRIDDALAWLDCTIEEVVDAGDHEIVLGRVDALEEGSSQPPLIFFRGAMGEFRPRSLVLAEQEHSLHLRLLDRLRAPLERLAEELDAELLLGGRVGGELAILATAGTSDASPLTLAVGERFPLRAPLGRTIMAFAADDEVAAWAKGDPDRAAPESLERIRKRGYSATSGALDNSLATATSAAALAALDRGGELDDPAGTGAGCVTVPIRDIDGTVRFALAAYAMERTGFRAPLDEVVARLHDLGDRIGAALTPSDRKRKNGVDR